MRVYFIIFTGSYFGEDNTINKRSILYVGIIFICVLLIPMSIADATPFAYITNSGDNTVSVVDTATNLVIKSVNVGNEPYGVAVSPDGKKAYVANSRSNNISIINTTNNVVIANVTVGNWPEGVAVSPDGKKAYVTNANLFNILSEYGTVSVIDTETNTVTANVSVGKSPCGIACSPDGNKIYVANYGDDNISVIDTDSNTVVFDVRVGVHPEGIAVSPDGKKVYVTCLIQGAPNFYVIDTTKKAVVANLTVGDNPFGVAVNPAGTKVYTASYNVSNNSNNVYIIDTASNNVTATVKVGGTIPFGSTVYPPYGISFTPDGSKAYVVNYLDNNVSVLDTATNNITATVNVGKGPKALGQFIVPPTQLVLLVANFSSNVTQGYIPLYVHFTDLSTNATSWNWDFGDGTTSTEQNPTHTYSEPENYEVTLIVTNGVGQSTKESRINVMYNATGTYAYISNNLDSTVSVIDTDRDKVINTLNVGPQPYGIAVSPDGKKVYTANSGNNNISIIDTTTNNVTYARLVNLPYVAQKPYGIAISPDGRKVYVSDYLMSTLDVYDIATNNVTPVKVGDLPAGIAVSPDGKKVYVTCSGNRALNGSSVYVINTTNKNVESIVYVGSTPQGIAISPDGKKVYVTCLIWDAPNVYIIDTETNNITTTSIGTSPFGIAVNPAGTKLYTVSSTVSPSNPINVINYLYVSDTTTNNVIATVKLGGKAAFGVAVSPDGSKVYAVDNDDNSVYVINTTTNNVTSIVKVGNGPIALGQFIGPSIYSPTPVIPFANFTSNITLGYVPLTVQFNDLSTNATGWAWNFGDGNSSTQQNPIHTYSTTGIYTVNLTATNAYGTDSKLATINVSEQSLHSFPSYTNPPTDLNQDDLYEDINGNGILDFDDVVAYYDNMEWIEEKVPIKSFDYNKNGLIDFDDVVKLYDML